MQFKIEFLEKPMNDTIALPKKIPQHKVETSFPMFDFKDPYLYQDFLKQFTIKKFADYEDLDKHLSKYFPRVVGRALHSERSYFKKMEGYTDVSKTFKNCQFSMFYYGEDGKEKELTLQ